MAWPFDNDDGLLNAGTNFLLGSQLGGAVNLGSAVTGVSQSDMPGLGPVLEGAGDYFMGPTNAAEAQAEAARQAQGHIQQGYDQALPGAENMAGWGYDDLTSYRNAVGSGAFQTNPNLYQTGQYQAQDYSGGAPGFNQFNPGAGPQYNQFGMGQDPGFNKFDPGQGPQFQGGPQSDFNFDYQESPGFQHALTQGLDAVKGRHSGQGSRFSGGMSKDLVNYATGAAAQDYGQQYGRARHAYESERGYGAGQANLANQFGQNQFQFGAGMGANQSNLANQYGQGAFQFGQNMGFAGNQAANQQGMQNFWNSANMGANQSNLANAADMNNYWTGQGMNQGESQFGANFNLGANQQNYGMFNQQNMQQAGLAGGLSNQGYNSMNNLNNMYINQGAALGNAALGIGNANASSAMAMQNTINPLLNTGAQIGGAMLGGGFFAPPTAGAVAPGQTPPPPPIPLPDPDYGNA